MRIQKQLLPRPIPLTCLQVAGDFLLGPMRMTSPPTRRLKGRLTSLPSLMVQTKEMEFSSGNVKSGY